MSGLQIAPRGNFWDFVNKNEESCWVWKGTILKTGYGIYYTEPVGIKRELAHRFSYKLYYWKDIQGLDVHHHCFNKACVNPLHLEAMTKKQHQIFHKHLRNK